MIVLGAMDVGVENCALVENGLEYFSVLYICLSSNSQFYPLLLPMFYIPELCGPE